MKSIKLPSWLILFGVFCSFFLMPSSVWAVGCVSATTGLFDCDQTGSQYGHSVASAGDVNGDGFDDVVVGAFSYDNSETDEGIVLVYHGSATGLNPEPAVILEIDQASAHFGRSVASAGDVNNDGFDDIIVGAPYYDGTGAINEGAAFIFHGSSTGLPTSANTLLEGDQFSALLG